MLWEATEQGGERCGDPASHWTLEIIIEQAGRSTNRYGYDADAGRIRLIGVTEASHRPVGFDIGRLTGEAKRQRVLVLVPHATFPGCFVRAHLLGAVHACAENEEMYLVAAAQFEQEPPLLLDAPVRAEIEQWIQAQSEPAAHPGWMGHGFTRPCLWLSADKAAAYLETLEHAGQPTGIPEDVTRERLLRLPYRFQQYLASYLLPEERILHMCCGPRDRSRFWNRTHQPVERVILLTDRQLVVMDDVQPGDITLIPWGYELTATALERVRGVCAMGHPEPALVVEIQAGDQVERCCWKLPQVMETQRFMGAARGYLHGFVPQPGTRAMQWSPATTDQRPDWQIVMAEDAAHEREVASGMIPASAIRRLQARLHEILEPEEQALAQTYAPASQTAKLPVRLVAVTARRVLIIADGHARSRSPAWLPARENVPEVEAIPLAGIALVQVRSALLGCWLRVIVPGKRPVRVDFPSPLLPGFVAVAQQIRQLLPLPAAAIRRERGKDGALSGTHLFCGGVWQAGLPALPDPPEQGGGVSA